MAILGALLLVASACGSGASNGQDADEGVASLTEDPTATTTPAAGGGGDELEAPTDPEDAFALFNECLGEHGIEGNVATAVVGGDDSAGAVEIDELESDGFDPQAGSGSFEAFDPEEFEAAMELCEGHLANIDTGFDLSPEEQAALEDAQLEFNDCMAEHGIEMPEVAAGSDGIVTNFSVGVPEGDPQSAGASLDGPDFDFEAFNEAAQACDSVFDQLEAPAQ